MTLGERIRYYREAAGLSQSEVEKKTGIKREYLSKLENNKLKNPTYGTLTKLANGLEIDLVVLITDNPQVLAILIPSSW